MLRLGQTECKRKQKKPKKQDVIWARLTRPHNLLADWSQEEEKNVYRERGGRKTKIANMRTEILT